MGKRSTSPRRRRSRSRERRRSRSRERRDDKRDRKREDKQKREVKSTYQGIVDAKKAVRDSLQMAASSISIDALSHTQEAVEEDSGKMRRSRAIADIDSEGFKQRSFKSTGGGAGGRVYTHKDERKKTEKAEEVHQSIIFGPSCRLPDGEKEEEMDDIALALKEEPRDVFPAVCSEEREAREARWLEMYKERKQRVISSS